MNTSLPRILRQVHLQVQAVRVGAFGGVFAAPAYSAGDCFVIPRISPGFSISILLGICEENHTPCPSSAGMHCWRDARGLR